MNRCPDCGCFLSRPYESDIEWADPDRPDLGRTIWLQADCRTCGQVVVLGEMEWCRMTRVLKIALGVAATVLVVPVIAWLAVMAFEIVKDIAYDEGWLKV